MKRLIVNADDFGRTPGVNAGVLEAHLRGVVTSATAMVLEKAAAQGIREAPAKAPRLSLGLHFVVTGGGAPASAAGDVPVLAPGGVFARNREGLPDRIPADEVRRELDAQIARFHALAGRLPTHLDSHHHAALHSDVAPVFAEVARRLSLPVRAASDEARLDLRAAGVRTPDRFLDAFYGEGAVAATLERLLDELPEGTSELMCHPGRADAELKRLSTYAGEREREIAVLCDPGIRQRLTERKIALIGYDAL